jgi:hypothetical protein
MTTRLVMLGALLVPALAAAQPAPNDPNAPTPTEVSPPPPPAPPAPDTTPAPDAPVTSPGPTVIVNPPAPAPAPVVTTMPDPPYRVVYDSYNAPVFATGALVFVATYGASVITAATTDNERGNDRLYVPVVGPWLALNDRGSCDITRSACDHETTAKVLLIADGVFQAAGIVGMLDGLLQPSSHREVLVTGKIDRKTRVRPTMVSSATGSSPGIAVLGHF